MANENVGSAYVELRAEFGRLESDIRTGVSDALRGVGTQAERSGEDVQAAFREAARQSAAELERLGVDDIWRDMASQAERAGEQIESAMAEAARASEADLERIGGQDTWGDVERGAERAGESIEGSMREAARQSEQALDGIGGSFGRIGGLLAGALAAAGIGQFVADSVSGANEAAAGFRQLEQVIATTGQSAGFTAEQMAAAASDLSFRIGVDDDEVIAAQTTLATFRNVSGETFTEATSLAADMSAVFGQDLSASSVQLGKALNDPIRGITALGRVGVTFTEAQKAQIEAMVQAGDVAGAQGIILDELRNQVGGAAEAAATGAQKMAVAWGEVQESFGAGIASALDAAAPAIIGLLDEIAPVMETFGNSIGEFIGPLVEALGPALQTALGGTANLLGKLGQIFLSLAPLIDPIVSIVSMLANTIGDALVTAFQALEPAITIVAEFLGELVEVMGEGLGNALEAITPAIMLIGQVLGDVLAAVLPIILDLFTAMYPILTAVGEVLSGVLAAVLPIIADALTAVLEALAPVIPVLQEGLLQIITALEPIIPLLAEALGNVALALVSILTALIPLLPPLIELVVLIVEQLGVPVLMALAQALVIVSEVLAALAQVVVAILVPVLQTLISVLTSVVTWFGNIGNHIRGPLQAAWNFLRTAVGAVRDFISGAVTAIVGFFTALPGRIIGAFGDGFAWLRTKATQVKDWISSRVGDIVGFITGLPGRIATAFGDGFKFLRDKAQDVKDWVGDRFDDIVGFVTGMPGRITSAASGMWDGITNAFKSAINILIRGWNALEFRIPGFDPPGPGPKFGGITIGVPDIPLLATGGVLDRPTVALLGEYATSGSDPEIAAPQSLMFETVLAALSAMSRRGGGVGGDGPLVAMYDTVIEDATDADLVAQRLVNTLSAVGVHG